MNNDDDQWKKACADNFNFIKQLFYISKDRISAAKIAQIHDDMELYKFQIGDKMWNLEDDKLKIQRQILSG